MNPSDLFQPNPSLLTLIFSCSRNGSISDLQQGIRICLMRYYPQEVSFRMASAPSFFDIGPNETASRRIVLMADRHSLAEAVLIDLYARLQQRQSQIRTATCIYSVALDGSMDHQRVTAVCLHYLWIDSCFERHLGTGRERFRLN